jgi:hypothetical protein
MTFNDTIRLFQAKNVLFVILSIQAKKLSYLFYNNSFSFMMVLFFFNVSEDLLKNNFILCFGKTVRRIFLRKVM